MEQEIRRESSRFCLKTGGKVLNAYSEQAAQEATDVESLAAKFGEKFPPPGC